MYAPRGSSSQRRDLECRGDTLLVNRMTDLVHGRKQLPNCLSLTRVEIRISPKENLLQTC